MKISPQTLQILKNFMGLNAMFISDGQTPNMIRTISQNGNIVALAKIPEDVPNFQVHDLSEFLRAVDLVEDPDFEFHDDHVVMSQGRTKIRYQYCSPQVIDPKPPKGVRFPAADVTFNISKVEFAKLMKASAALSLQCIVFTRVGDQIVAALEGKANESKKNQFALNLESEIVGDGEDFRAIFVADNFKFIGGDVYKVELSKHKLSRWSTSLGTTDQFSIEYVVGMQAESTFKS